MADDRYKYFRIEAREILEALTRGGLELERGGAAKETVPELLRLAHTLKGAARVVGLVPIANDVHAIEDALAPHRDHPGAIPPDPLDRILTLVGAIGRAVRALDGPVAPHVGGAGAGRTDEGGRAARTRDDFETVRVEIAEMDALLEGIAETTVQVGALRSGLQSVQSATHHAAGLVDRIDLAVSRRGGEVESLSALRVLAAELRASLDFARGKLVVAADRATRELAEVRDRTDRLRLIPAGLLFDSLERAMRDAATELGRAVTFETSGGDMRLDQPVLSALGAALLHVVRNAVVHGIEPPDQRVASGKPRAGRIELRVERQRGRVAVTCSDDGRGIDVEAVRQAALARGLVTADEARDLDLDGVLRLLRGGGVSTARALSQMAGRGIGLQVLGALADQFKGKLDLTTQAGRGTTVAINVPVSLTSVPALVAEVSDVVVAVPRDAVASTLRVKRVEIVRGVDGDTIAWKGRAIAFAPLVAILGLPAPDVRGASSFVNVILLETDAASAAVGVDRIHGLSRLVVRELPRAVRGISTIAGASLDADGNPWLVLDPAGVVQAVRAARGEATARDSAPRRPLLVIDDSLTTRMLERTILEAAGYEVDVATSGEEGLAKAQKQSYGAFIVDVEMPGMDGFEFVQRTRADARLRDTPSILVTSLGSPEHKRRGLEVGARGYIVKSEFDELALLGLIRNLIG